MNAVLHECAKTPRPVIRARASFLSLFAAAGILAAAPGLAQVPGQGIGRPSQQPIVPSGDDTSTPAPEKPDKAAKRAFDYGMKALAKARDNEAAAATAGNPDKKAKLLEKVGDSYNAALDAFTEALANKGDMVEAWNNVGYVHLRLGAYGEALDDYNHTLALKPDLIEAVERRAEAYVALDRLDEAEAAYMDLFNHAPNLADQLMSVMQKWLVDHRADAHGMRASSIDAFDKWLSDRQGIAKQTAALPH